MAKTKKKSQRQQAVAFTPRRPQAPLVATGPGTILRSPQTQGQTPTFDAGPIGGSGGGVPGGPLGGVSCPGLPQWLCDIAVSLGTAAACRSARGLMEAAGFDCATALGLGGGGGAGGGTQFAPTTQCSPPFVWDAATSQCIDPSLTGRGQRLMPGGQTGTQGAGGTAVIGAFGKPGVVPAVVGAIRKADGTSGPILRCPSGMVLGKDVICYMKSVIGVRDRRWRPRRKPAISARDMAALSSIDRVQKRVKELASKAGLSTRKKGASAPRRKPTVAEIQAAAHHAT